MEGRDRAAPATAVLAVAEWVLRVLLALVPALILVFSAASVLHHPIEGSLGALVSGYIALGLLAPKLLKRLTKEAGRAIRRPYKAFIGPKIVRPIDGVVVGTGRLIEALVLFVWKLGLWLVGLGLALGIGAALLWGVTKLPISVAVIIGAFIIAGALSARR